MVKLCNACGLEKTYDEFHNRTAAADGKDTQCKECRKKYKYIPTTLEQSEDNVRIPAERVLTALGYELYNEDNPVSKQFIERIATKYNYK